ncbi:hypothetical protein STENM223S_04442 [Streptomyces tendae]
MREALDLLVRYAFGPMRLHRLEINVQPGNAASIALARACGFRKELLRRCSSSTAPGATTNAGRSPARC